MICISSRLRGSSSSTTTTVLFLSHLLYPPLRQHKAEGHIGSSETAALERAGKECCDLSFVQGPEAVHMLPTCSLLLSLPSAAPSGHLPGRSTLPHRQTHIPESSRLDIQAASPACSRHRPWPRTSYPVVIYISLVPLQLPRSVHGTGSLLQRV
ncbi:hypothetical protein IQ06DRAFT_288729, partial [Phaeosphaeriaceae sp. SRC1lsM3a]